MAIQPSPSWSPACRETRRSAREADLLAFLESLSDRDFVANPDLACPALPAAAGVDYGRLTPMDNRTLFFREGRMSRFTSHRLG